MLKLLLLVAAIAAVKTDFVEDKVINHSWKILALSPSQGVMNKVPENCLYGINVTRSAVVDCTCGPVKAHLVDTVRIDGISIKDLFVSIESREDIHAIREITCNCPAGISGDGRRIYVKELESGYLLTAPDEGHKLNYLVLGKTVPTQAKLQDLLKAADVVKGEPKENWIVICVKPDN